MSKKICLIGGEDVHKRIPLSKYLLAKNYKVTIIGTSVQEFPGTITYVPYNLNRKFSPTADLKTIKWLRNFFSTHQFDIIHTFDTKPAFLVPIALKQDKTPITRTITGLGTIFMSNNISSYVLRKIYRLLHRRIKHRISKTVFQNTDDKALYIKKGLVSEGTSELIFSSGIDLTQFNAKAHRNNEVFTFICIARVVFEKGILNLLEAARICKNNGYNFKCLLVGPLEENSNKLNATILKSYDDVIERLGERQDVFELLLSSDALVLPTFREGFARVLLEAAAVGLPIMSTNFPGVREFVRHQKEGLIIEPRDSEGLANAMIQLANEKTLADKLAENAHKRVKMSSLENISNQYIAIFDNVINAHK